MLKNECIEAIFPANNPVEGVPEVRINNPMTPLNENSFWCEYMQSFFNEHPEDIYDQLVHAVHNLFQEWEREFNNNPEIHIEYKEPYFIGENKILTKQAGIRQIKDYADHCKKENLKIAYKNVQEKLDGVKKKFHTMLMDKNGLDYFGKARISQESILKKVEEIEKREVKNRRVQRRRKPIFRFFVPNIEVLSSFFRLKSLYKSISLV